MSPAIRRLAMIATLTLIVGAALAWSFWPRPVEVELARVGRGPMRVEVSDEARTRIREIYQLAAPVGGRLLRIEVHPGDSVEGGRTKVAELEPIAPAFLDSRTRNQALAAIRAAEANRSLAEAEVTRARAARNFAASELKRAVTLGQSSAISKSDLERAQLADDTAAAQLATAEAAVRARHFELEAARAALIEPDAGGKGVSNRIGVIAPISGRVLKVTRESEAPVPAGTTILEIGDPRRLEIVADLVSEDAVKVHEGDSARITDWGGDGALNARVRRIEPSGFTKVSALGVEEQRVNILLDFTDPPARWARIADGFRVFVHIAVWQSGNVLQVPGAALFRQGKGWAVFAVKDGHAVLTTVRIGHSNDEVSEVLGGLRPGDAVIAHPSDRVADGARVIPAMGR
jgi:HlyD family secretion protein